MSRDQALDTSILESKDQLVAYFQEGVKTADQLYVGTEHEKFLFDKTTGKPAVFDGDKGIAWLLEEFGNRFDWTASYDQGHIVALEGPDGAITLEPGGQLELSGAVRTSIHDTQAEMDRHLQQLKEIAGDTYYVTSFGIQPFDDLDAIGWMPKSRYGIMRSYLSGQGGHAHWMMKGTCTIQSNVDYRSEADAVDIVTTSIHGSPFVNAMFGNSRIRKGADSGFASYRANVWTDVDPDRTGVPDFMATHDWGFDEYVEYILDVPMFFIRREGYVAMPGHSFRDFWKNGFEGHRATMGDFELHLSTAFPEVRLKQFIEMRSADGGPASHVAALSALWKGLLYDETARDAFRSLVVQGSASDLRKRFAACAKDGLEAQTDLGDACKRAADILAISRAGLTRLAKKFDHETEAIYLDVLDGIVSGKTAGTRFFETFDGDRTASLIAWDMLA